MKVLIVYWNLYTMSANVAGKSSNKHYKVSPQRTLFPETFPITEAINNIFSVYGERPAADKSVCIGHKFAEIRYTTYAEVERRKHIPGERLDQTFLFDTKEMASTKDSTPFF